MNVLFLTCPFFHFRMRDISCPLSRMPFSSWIVLTYILRTTHISRSPKIRHHNGDFGLRESALLLPSFVLGSLDHRSKLLPHPIPVLTPHSASLGALVGPSLGQDQACPNHVPLLLLDAFDLLLHRV